MGKLHLLTIVAYPGVPEPPLEEPEPEPEPEPKPEETPLFPLLEELATVVVAGGGAAAATGLGHGAVPDHDGWFHGFHGAGAESIVMAKKPMVTMTVMGDPKERMVGKGRSVEL